MTVNCKILWMNLKGIRQCEKSHLQKTKYCMSSFFKAVQDQGDVHCILDLKCCSPELVIFSWKGGKMLQTLPNTFKSVGFQEGC